MRRATNSYKFMLFLGFAALYCGLYVYPNLFPLYHPGSLPLFDFESRIPFLPETFLVYLSDYLLVLLTILAIEERERFDSFARMAYSILFLCGFFYLSFPTTYPRPNYPDLESGIVRLAMGMVGGIDTPNNCFPSMHVANTGVCAWSLRYKGTRTFAMACLWCTLIYVSTLTTKQHYFVDILGGLAVVAAAAFIDRWYVQRYGMKAAAETFSKTAVSR